MRSTAVNIWRGGGLHTLSWKTVTMFSVNAEMSLFKTSVETSDAEMRQNLKERKKKKKKINTDLILTWK